MAFRMVAELLLVTSIAFGTWQSRAGRGDGDWQSFGRDPGARRFSPLTQINTKNVASLVEAWTFDTGVQDLQVTPIVIDGLMYFTGGSTVFALEPETGKTVWTFRAQGAVSRRGVAYGPVGGRPHHGCSPALCSGRRRCQEKNDADYRIRSSDYCE